MAETREQLESSRSHWATRAGHAERERDQLYEKLRRLENMVRKTCVIGERIETDALYKLREMVPNHPRETITERRRGKKRSGKHNDKT